MIVEVCDCTNAEIGDHIGYLQQQDGWGSSLAGLLLDEGGHLKRAVIDSVCHLGLMPTAFGELGLFSSKDLYGAPKFLVCQVLPTLQRIQSPEGNTKEVLDSIKQFMDMDAGGLKGGLRITAVEELCAALDGVDRKAWEYVIRDGCKRSVAFYESAKLLKIDRTTFRIYLVTKR